MNITFLIQDITTEGGTERTTCCLANTFARYGHDVAVVSIFKENDKPFYKTDHAVKITYVSSEKYSLELGKVKRAGRIIRQLPHIKSCKEIKNADVVISQKLLASVTLWLTGLAHKAIACEHFKYEMYTPAVRRIRNMIYRTFLTTVVLTDNDQRKYAPALPCVEVIPNMVSVSPKPYQGADSKTIITVGRLDKQKGYDLLLQALPEVFTAYPDWHLNIFGNGHEYESLARQRDELGLADFVTFKGYIQDIEREYAVSSFFVLSSRFEGFPMVLLEAAACGLPIVSFDCPEGPSTLLKNQGGILVPAEDIAQLSVAIKMLIEDRHLRNKLSQRSLEIVRPYASDNIYNKWIELFHKYNIPNSCKQA